MTEKKLGDFKLVKLIGEGTLGKVYSAEQTFMKKYFAIKILPEDLAQDRAFIQRFEEDIAMLSHLNHPNIIKIHQVSHVEGKYLLVNDFAVDPEGESTTLNQYLKKNKERMSEELVYNLLEQVASALDYAHSKTVQGRTLAHLALKPSNILVTGPHPKPQFVMSDFGLMRIIGEGRVLTQIFQGISSTLATWEGQEEYKKLSPSEATKLQRAREDFLQSYAFLSPEQKRPESGIEIGTCSDVYSFGVLAYYLLTGAYPEGVFELPSLKNPELKMNWDRLIMTCLSANRDRRPKNLLERLFEIKGLQQSKRSPKLQEPIEKPLPTPAQEKIEDPYPMMNLADNELERMLKEQEAQISGSASVASTVPVDCVRTPIKKMKEVTPEKKEIPQTLAQQTALLEPEVTEKKEEELKPVSAYSPVESQGDTDPVLTEMVSVSGGRYMRGSNEGSRDEMPRHEVVLADFAIDVHPVTNEQYVRFLRTVGSEKDPNNNDMIRLKESRIKRTSGKWIIEPGYNKHPVVGVTWYGATAYTRWVGKRLPTEAEWEVAGRGGKEELTYPNGDTIEKSQANFFNSDTTAVMSYPSNGIGIFDMAGNIYEWCHDWYAYNTYEMTANEPMYPSGPLQGVYRVLRGGCWKSLKEDLRCAHRHRNNPGAVNRTYGFRCAQDLS